MARQRAIAAHKSGDILSATRLYQSLVDSGQADGACLANLALIHKSSGRIDLAIACYRHAVRLEPGNSGVHLNLSNLLNRQGSLDDAIAHSLAALAIDPSLHLAHLNLSSIFIKQSRFDDALNSCLEALRLAPRLATAHVNIASIYLKRGDFTSALNAARQAAVLDPNLAEAYQSIGTILIQVGDYPEALLQTREALRLKPGLPEAQLNLGSILIQMERYLDALVPTRQAIALRPEMAKAHMNLACIYSKLDRHSDAVLALKESFRLEPGLAEAHCLLSDLYLRLGDLDEATAAITDALKLSPDCTAYQIKAISLYDAICDFSALSSIDLEQLLLRLQFHSLPAERSPGLLELTMHYLHHAHTMQDNLRYLKVARSLSDALAEQVQSSSSPAMPEALLVGSDISERPLRIGFLSGDFRDHVVGRFLLPLYSHIDQSRFDFFSYSTTEADDPFNRLFRNFSARFCDCSGLTTEELLGEIRADQIDIMIDLAGFTKGCRSDVFIRRAAPIQISWMGYPASSGMPTMDYLLLDRHLLTVQTEQLLSEKPLVTDGSFLCFEQWPDWRITSSLPEQRVGSITFGTLNHPRKYTLPTLERWAKVLHACPGSRFLFARSETSSVAFKTNLLNAFAGFGISSDRLIFQPTSDGSYLESYNQIDICLDTYPYTGTTTTVDTLWMGVPVVSLEGFSIHQRASAAVLRHAGCDRWVAQSDDQFVAIACEIASNPDERKRIRSGLRDQLRRSILCDGSRYAQDFALLMESLRPQLSAMPTLPDSSM